MFAFQAGNVISCKVLCLWRLQRLCCWSVLFCGAVYFAVQDGSTVFVNRAVLSRGISYGAVQLVLEMLVNVLVDVNC